MSDDRGPKSDVGPILPAFPYGAMQLDDWGRILDERQRVRLQRSIEKALAPASS